MEKKMNGLPDLSCLGRVCPCLSEDPTLPDVRENGNAAHNHSCGGDGSCLDEAPLAYLYAPNQKFRMLYSAQDALSHGTLFEELYKPMEVYGRE